MTRVGVLVPLLRGDPGHPRELPIGRAALRLRAEGIEVVFGDRAADGRLHGMIATPDGYEPVSTEVSAALDRFPSQTRPADFARLREGLGDTRIANAPALTLLCRDKLATQRALEAGGLPIPPVETDPTRFADAVERWTGAFLKPQYGAFGRGIRLVRPGEPLPATGPGSVADRAEPLFVQRPVAPAAGWAGLACRVLVQRTHGGWWIGPPVARASTSDPVVNAGRGAEVHPLATLRPDAVAPVVDLARQTADCLAAQPEGDDLVELGVDVVVGSEELAVLEVNSKPRGRLEALADLDPVRYAEAHVEACARPLRFLSGARPW